MLLPACLHNNVAVPQATINTAGSDAGERSEAHVHAHNNHQAPHSPEDSNGHIQAQNTGRPPGQVTGPLEEGARAAGNSAAAVAEKVKEQRATATVDEADGASHESFPSVGALQDKLASSSFVQDKLGGSLAGPQRLLWISCHPLLAEYSHAWGIGANIHHCMLC